MVTVTGGKLTTYREMAEDAVDAVVRLLPRGAAKRRSTKRLRLIGAKVVHRCPAPMHDLTRTATFIVGTGRSRTRSGRWWRSIPRSASRSSLVCPICGPRRSTPSASEMATTLDDILCRRTRAHLLDRAASLAAAPDVAALLADELGWDEATTDAQVGHYRALCAAEEIAGEHVANTTH